ncbi:hypothetical protein HMJ29_11010 [Hymenobacter taeanensis]|uniref:Uncharacterized protein n=1 Tax=Hymenobacter taeanensis TaxID=2735321 RepID=A0A6M6BHR2_9BACT|nr:MULTISPECIES: hypothetical protein [Hymenobacter]QJX47438.1 hypothetical protein HMJ29_11010 [Hymenobacter taeanensis]UOQ83080.1 hypothetical protein MUN83_10105 [Hymenobacter sp. 5414T-23]
MILRCGYLLLYALYALAMTSCNQPKSDKREAILTGNGKGRYWDLVSSNNGLNRYNLDIWAGRSYSDKRRGIPTSTLLFSANNKLMYYMNLDSTTIINMNTVAGDVVYNPANYKLMGNKISLIGDTSEIVLLNKEIMVLKKLRRGYIRIYMPSKWQKKVESKVFR